MLRADLFALVNLARTRDGRNVLLSTAIVVACVGLGALALTGSLLLRDPVLSLVRGDEIGVLVRAYYGLALVAPLLMVVSLGTAQLHAELYASPHAPLLLTAPVSPFAIVTRAFARSLVVWTLFAVALGVPPILGLADRSPVPATPALVFPFVAVLLLAPVVAFQTLLKVVLVRWLSRPWLRQAFTALQVTAALALFVFGMLGVVAPDALAARLGAWLEGGPGGAWPLDAPAAVLNAVAGREPDPALARSALWLLALPAPLLGLAALGYRRSYEVFCVAGARVPLQRIRRRGWPSTPLRSLLARSVAQTVRGRSNLVAYALFAALMGIAVARIDASAPGAHQDRVPAVLHETFGLLLAWQGLAALIATVTFLGVIGDEQKQLPLYATAPFERRWLLDAKLVVAASPFTVLLLAAVVSAIPASGFGLAALGGFLAAAIPSTLYLVGLLAAIGTWPRIVRVHDDVPLANNLRSILPVVLIGAAALGALLASVRVKAWLVASYYEHGPFAGHDLPLVLASVVAAAWTIGVATFLIGRRLGLRNVETLLGPQDE